MITRAKNGIRKSKMFLTTSEPINVDQALQDERWRDAMTEEFQALMRNGTWSLVPLPNGRKVIGYKWVFRVKENVDGTINKFKVRLVAKGFHQFIGCDFSETFSPVVKPTTIRTVLSIALSK